MNKPYLALALVLIAGLTTVGLGSALAQNMSSSATNATSSSASNSSSATSANTTSSTSANSTSAASTNQTGDTFTAQGYVTGIIFSQNAPASSATTTSSNSSATGISSANATSSGITNSTTSGNTTASAATNSSTPATSTPAPSTSVQSYSSNSSTSAAAVNATSASNATSSAGMSANATTPAPTSTTVASTAPVLPYIMAGNWSLSVQSGKVSSLTANFIMVHTDGTDRHTHTLANFKEAGSTPIVLSQHTPIMGTVDITKNGQTLFSGVNVAIMIENQTVASMALDSHATQNHFGGQPIYVVFTSFKDKTGTELLPSSSTTNTSAASTNPLSSAVNATGSLFSNITKSVTGAFNKTK